jgi:phage terminase large subunit-like protein
VVLEAALHERADGRWSTPQVGVSTPRQNGKSQLIVARALAGALVFDEKTIIISAHQQDTAREVFTASLT